jgi:hypothetical protein
MNRTDMNFKADEEAAVESSKYASKQVDKDLDISDDEEYLREKNAPKKQVTKEK